jgi:pilus assembly protein Flp/PilA
MFKDRSGATAIEYALIASLVSVAAIIAFQQLGGSLIDVWDNIATHLDSVL